MASSETDGEHYMTEFVYDAKPSYTLKLDVEQALARHAVDKELIFGSKPWRDIKLQDLLP